MFTATTSLYPDEMVERSAALGPMLAKRSKARAHYTAAALQKRRRSRERKSSICTTRWTAVICAAALRGVRAGHGRRGGIGARAHQRGVDVCGSQPR